MYKKFSLLLKVNIIVICVISCGGKDKKDHLDLEGCGVLKIENANITSCIDSKNGRLTGLHSVGVGTEKEWLSGSWEISFTNTQSGEKIVLDSQLDSKSLDTISFKLNKPSSGFWGTAKWNKTREGVRYNLSVNKEGERTEYSCRISIPVNGKSCYGFASTQSGVFELKEMPLSINYGGVNGAIMPLMSILDTSSDQALTVAVAADCFLPKIKMYLTEDTLRFDFSHFGLGVSKPVEIALVFYSHAVDYRAALKAYSTDFPRWFRSPLTRNPHYEGAFWYHHIMEIPDKEELFRQNVRAIWSSFYFEVIGQFLPMRDEGDEWYPYTYSRTWSRQKYAGTDPIKEKMTYNRIRSFTDSLKNMGIAHYAYFNYNEYGGISQNSDRFKERLEKDFANSVRYKVDGTPVEAWEGSTVMNPDPSRAFGKHLIDQAKLHLEKIPSIAGFCVDQLHHESYIDYSPNNKDNITMVNGREAYHLGIAVMDINEQLCKEIHKQGKQLYLNNSWKLSSMKDIDGFMYEFPRLRALSYCAPYRYLAGWHHLKDYYNTGDLLQFEANLKRRLKYAVFPHMIPARFKICQQRPDKKAAAMLEIYAPLFRQLQGKEQVLDAHCIAVSGANEANLFRNTDGQYVIPVISRIRFLTRRTKASEKTQIKLSTHDVDKIKWACVYSDNNAPYFVSVEHASEGVIISLDRHYSASVIVTGTGNKPQEPEWAVHIRNHLASTFPYLNNSEYNKEEPLYAGELTSAEIRIQGQYVDDQTEGRLGFVSVWVNEKKIGHLSDNNKPGFQGLIQREEEEQTFFLSPDFFTQISSAAPVVKLKQIEEESWYAPQKVELWLTPMDGNAFRAAVWYPQTGTLDTGLSENIIAPSIELALQWIINN